MGGVTSGRFKRGGLRTRTLDDSCAFGGLQTEQLVSEGICAFGVCMRSRFVGLSNEGRLTSLSAVGVTVIAEPLLIFID